MCLKRTYIFLCFAITLSLFALAQQPAVNYDEAKVGQYILPDPLRFANGKKVRNAKDWQRRRKEILDIFQKEMYGQMPAPAKVYLETLEEGTTLAGYGLRRQVRMWFRSDKSGPHVDWLIVTPQFIKHPVPAVLLLNYYGNHTLLKDKEIVIPTGWMDNSKENKIENNHASEAGRGICQDPNRRSVFPIASLLAQGYAFVTACYADISPDPERTDFEGPNIQDELPYSGIFDLWGPRNLQRTDNTTALSAWAWVLMRGMDMLEQDTKIDAKRVVLTGSSRLGKAALIAGAFDERFPVVVLNQTGGGGVPLAKRNYGENLFTEQRSYSHWFCKAYWKYAGREAEMPFDQHMMVSCIAPRALLVEGFDHKWFDPKGEYLSLQAASPVWQKLGKKGLPRVAFPPDYDTSAIGPWLGYVRRDQAHGIAAIDWKWMLDFADGVFQRK